MPSISEILSDRPKEIHPPHQQHYYASIPSNSMANRNEPERTTYDRVYHDCRSAPVALHSFQGGTETFEEMDEQKKLQWAGTGARRRVRDENGRELVVNVRAVG